MTSLPKDPTTPLGEDDRDEAVRRLREAYAEGHLAHEEMDDRLGQVLTAKTHGELAPLLASLPPEKEGATSTIGALSGRIRRRGEWRVPRTLKVQSAMGRVHLDLSRAIIEHPVVDIELHLGTGRSKITVPHDAIVDFEGVQAVWKETLDKSGRPSRPGGPKIRISGAMGMGRLTIRRARR
ncbi:DUF1707 SHOCT-like domain-containing protein [Streptomyces lasiicapitis]|uniref:DUF1707 domain-containing protein n=1 Tax=Streptomyces lasiicapitis TaxID=1923961 RepID=A0ABQ2M2J0_9ACTN|nr:DUF1707 domain-containing protein [Streptomyces lasiicapitis]GGO46385.1 hypothetical protein GCM10012286_37180 [Streptomyces lasiicapitis]